MKVVEKMICEDVLDELITLGYFKSEFGCFYKKLKCKKLMLFLCSSGEMKKKVKRALMVYNRTLDTDPIPRGIQPTPQMIGYVLKKLPIYRIEIIKLGEK